MSLTGAYDLDNIFAKIIRGDAPCHKVFEDEVAIAFLDIFPQARGHALVAPKTAARNFLDLPGDAVGPFMTRVQSVAGAVRSALQPDGLVLTQYNGAPAGQTVFHLHTHIIPAYGDAPATTHGGSNRADDAELAALAEHIAAHITP